MLHVGWVCVCVCVLHVWVCGWVGDVGGAQLALELHLRVLDHWADPPGHVRHVPGRGVRELLQRMGQPEGATEL